MCTRVRKAAEIVSQLQEWIEDRDGMSTIPTANFTYSEHTLQICIGDIPVYCSENTPDSLSLEACKREWLRYVWDFHPFMGEAARADLIDD